MTQLRRMMLEELQRRNYSPQTIRSYLLAVRQFAEHFGKRPDQLGPDELRTYQAYLLRERKLAVGTVVARVAALRFFYMRVLKRHQFREDLPYPKNRRRLPTVLSLEEVAYLINAAGNLLHRALLMTLYGTGMRRTERQPCDAGRREEAGGLPGGRRSPATGVSGHRNGKPDRCLRGGGRIEFLRRVACQVPPFRRLGQGAEAPDAPFD